MPTVDDTNSVPAIDASARISAFSTLIHETPPDDSSVRNAARELVREAKTDRLLAEKINSLADPDTRAALIQARDAEQAQMADQTRRAYLVTAARVAGDIADPERRARAHKVLDQLAVKLGARPMRERSRDRGREQDIEAGR